MISYRSLTDGMIMIGHEVTTARSEHFKTLAIVSSTMKIKIETWFLKILWFLGTVETRHNGSESNENPPIRDIESWSFLFPTFAIKKSA